MALTTKRRVAGLATTSAMFAAMAVAALPGATFAAAPRQCDTMVLPPSRRPRRRSRRPSPRTATTSGTTSGRTTTPSLSRPTDRSPAPASRTATTARSRWSTSPRRSRASSSTTTRRHERPRHLRRVTRPIDGAKWTLTNAPTNGTSITDAVRSWPPTATVVHTPQTPSSSRSPRRAFVVVTVDGVADVREPRRVRVRDGRRRGRGAEVRRNADRVQGSEDACPVIAARSAGCSLENSEAPAQSARKRGQPGPRHVLSGRHYTAEPRARPPRQAACL